MGIQVYATIGSLVFISAVPNTDMYRMGAKQIKEHDWERKKDLQKPKITDSQSSWAWNFVFLFIYVYGCFAYTYICATHAVTPEPDEGIRYPGYGVTNCCEPLSRCWALNLGDLKMQQVPSATEPSLQIPSLFNFQMFLCA